MPKYDVGEIITAFSEAVNKLDNLRTKYNDLEKENARLRAALKTARRDALKEAWLVIANKSALETPASFEDILQRDIEMMNAIRALGEKE